MAKIGLAAELAKQAAQAAREEVAAAGGETKKKAAPTYWTVPTLPEGFMLDQAVETATYRVAGHYQKVLSLQGLEVGLEPEMLDIAAQEPQQMPQLQANLREQVSGRLIKAYTTPALLSMYAAQQQATGIVVDGQV